MRGRWRRTKEVSRSVRKDKENRRRVLLKQSKSSCKIKANSRPVIGAKPELRDRTGVATPHLTLVVVQIQMLRVLLLSIPPPPLGRRAPLGPPVRKPPGLEKLLNIHLNAALRQALKAMKNIPFEGFTCCWWARRRERRTADGGRSPARSAPGQSSCPAGGGAGPCGRSLTPAFQWLSLLRRPWHTTLRAFCLGKISKSCRYYFTFYKNSISNSKRFISTNIRGGDAILHNKIVVSVKEKLWQKCVIFHSKMIDNRRKRTKQDPRQCSPTPTELKTCQEKEYK